MASSSSSNIPTYALSSTENDIEYSIFVPNLKAVKKLFGPNLSDNGNIDCEITESGFRFKFFGSKDLIGKNYHLMVSNFPCKIYPNKSSWKCRNGAVDVKLRILDNPKEIEAKLREESTNANPDTPEAPR